MSYFSRFESIRITVSTTIKEREGDRNDGR
jgi:hypothetical protein